MTPTVPAWVTVPANAPDTPTNWVRRLFANGPVSQDDIKAALDRGNAVREFRTITVPRILKELGVKQLDDGRLALPDEPPWSPPTSPQAIEASDDMSSVHASFDALEAMIATNRRRAASVPTREAAKELGGTRFGEAIASGKLKPWVHPDKGRVVDREAVDALKTPAERRRGARATAAEVVRQEGSQPRSQPQKRQRSTKLLDWIERHGGRG